MTKAANHIHRYKKVDIGSEKEYLVYRCMKPACSHYIPIHLSEGKMCECNRCFEPMIITKATLSASGKKPMTRPHCGNCIKKRKSADATDAIAAFLSGKIGG